MPEHDARSTPKSYGDTHIEDNARVQLGDRYATNRISIRNAYIALTEPLALLDIDVLERIEVEEVKPTLAGGRYRTSAERIDTRACEREGGCHKQRSRCDRDRRPEMGQKHFSILSQARRLSSGLVTSTPAPSSNGSGREMRDPASPSVSQQIRASSEMLLLIGVISSFLLGRNLTRDEIASFILRCQQDQFLPLLTFVLGIGIYRYLASTMLIAYPGTPSSTLEDAYGRCRPVSLDVLADFTLMRRFLEVHYTNTNGVAGRKAIKLGRSQLHLDSRRGLVLDAANWHDARFKTGSRIVHTIWTLCPFMLCPLCVYDDVVINENKDFYWCVTFNKR